MQQFLSVNNIVLIIKRYYIAGNKSETKTKQNQNNKVNYKNS
jgi:hypothetical protein